MESAKFNCCFILLFTFAAIIPSLNANIGIFDTVWQKRAEEAKQAALKAYKPDLSVGLLNQHPLKVLNGKKSNTTTQVVKGNAHLTKNITKPSGAAAHANQEKVKPNLTKNITKPSGAHANLQKVKPNLTTKNSTKPSAPLLRTGKNSTRRSLSNKVKYTGPCKATNPIDKCWRCQPLWERNRKKLADCSIGFGRGTTGGKAGRIYIVTNPSDDDVVNPRPGTLRHAVIQKEPLWIIFKRSMIIRLKQELIMQSHKTIDGRGAKVHIAYGAGITIQFVKNIIIHNIYIHDIKVTNGGLIRDSVDHIGLRTKSDGDGITIFGSTNIWLDHLSMYRCDDGIIDAIEGSTAITISNCHWTDHDKVLLFGARDTNVEDDYMQITVVYNHFGKRLVQRMPRVRSGFIHVVNNDYTHWNMYAIGGSHHATIISEGNRFIATTRPEFKQVTHRDAPESEWRKWTWRSKGDLFKKGAFFVESGDPNGVNRLGRLDGVVPKKAKAVKSLTRFAGVIGGCKPGVPC